MPKVLISGGSGLIGRQLSRGLREKGYEVALLSRDRKSGGQISSFYWDVKGQIIQEDALRDVDCIVHLAGANIGAKRWTAKRRKDIRDSRVKTGQMIFNLVKKQEKKPESFITSSATGYYGAITSQDVFSEGDPPSSDFLGQTCKEWEEIADSFSDLGVRSVKIRTGIVLSREGGALSKFMLPVRLGLGAALGSGKQYLPWIHMDDLCGIYIQAIENRKMVGAYNAVAPEHLTNKELNRIIAKILRKPLWLPNIPAVLIKLLFGKMSEMLLNGSRISAQKIVSTNYNFLFPDIESALNNCITNFTEGD